MQTRLVGAGLIALWFILTGAPASAQAFAQNLPANVFAKPSGPHAIGTMEWLWTDAQRREPYTKDPAARRKLPIQVIYPAEAEPGSARAAYIRSPEEFSANSQYKAVGHLETNAVADAPVAKASARYPVLIYSHGAGWSRFTGTFITEVLASHGYIVFSIDHPGLNRSVVFSDGTPFRRDTMPGPPMQLGLEGRAAFDASSVFMNAVVFPVWVDDSRFALDRIEELNRTLGPFQGRLDLDRIGMLGWSFGGAAAMEVSRIDPRVKATVNHDGALFGDVRLKSTNRPFMIMRHDIEPELKATSVNGWGSREMTGVFLGFDSTAERLTTADWYHIRIDRTNHGSFSDLPLLMQWDTAQWLPARRGHDIIVAYTLAFFDQYLKGKPSPLLAAPSAGYPEVQFRRK